MLEGDHQGGGDSGGPGWPVWIAASRAPGEIEREAARAGGRTFVRFLGGLGLLIAVLCYAWAALLAGHHEVLAWLAAGHLPLVAWTVQIARLWRRSEPVPEPTPPTERRRFGLYATLTDAGVYREGVLYLPWERCRGFAYQEADGPAFVVRLWQDAAAPTPPNRLRYALGLFALLTPALVTLASAFVGYASFGPRADVLAATWAALLHLLVTVPLLLSLFGGCQQAAPPSVDLIFDSRVVSTGEAMARIGRFVRASAPDELPPPPE